MFKRIYNVPLIHSCLIAFKILINRTSRHLRYTFFNYWSVLYMQFHSLRIKDLNKLTRCFRFEHTVGYFANDKDTRKNESGQNQIKTKSLLLFLKWI